MSDLTTSREAAVLRKLSRQHAGKANLRRRSLVIVLRTVDDQRREDVRQQGYSYAFHDRWYTRWEETLAHRREWARVHDTVDKPASDGRYLSFLSEVLSDRYRSGAPAKFSREVREKIMALAVTNPADLGLPFTRWSNELLRHEVVKRGIVASISTSRAGIFLKGATRCDPI